MAIDPTSLKNLQDLRAIIHSLKMNGLASVDPEAVDEIKGRIKLLPSAEEINRIAVSSTAIENLRNEIGSIMRLLEIYGKKDAEFKARYKSRTGLPPRYKVLEWRAAMQKEAKQVVRQIIKTSAYVDEKGNGTLADNLIKCAKNIQLESIDEQGFNEIIENLKLAGFEQEAKMIKEAAFPWMQMLQPKNVMEGLKSGWQALKGRLNIGKYTTMMQNITNSLNGAITELAPAVATATPEQQKALQSILNQMKNMQYIATNIKGDFEIGGHEVVEDVAGQPPAQEAPEPEPSEADKTWYQQQEGAVPPTTTPTAVPPTTTPTAAPAKQYAKKWVTWTGQDGRAMDLFVYSLDEKNNTFTGVTKQGWVKEKLPVSGIGKISPKQPKPPQKMQVAKTHFNLQKFAN